MHMESMLNFSSSNSSTNDTVYAFWQIGTLEIFMLTFSLLSVFPTHCYIIWLIVTGPQSALASEFFNLNLSVCDIVFAVNSLLILLENRIKFLTEVTQFFLGFVITGRPLFQCLICVERYVAVVHPVTFLTYKPLRYRLVCCALVWMYILATCSFSIYSFISHSFYNYVWFYTMQFLLFPLIQLFCLVAVLQALKQSGPGDRKKEKEEDNQMKRKAFNIIRVTTICLAITYVPFIVTGLFSVITFQNIQLLWSISYICFMLAGFVQPGLYLHRNGKLSVFKK